VFTGLRFLTGVGGAGELSVGAPYTAEMWPAKIRAIGTGGIMFSLYSCGYIVAALRPLYRPALRLAVDVCVRDHTGGLGFLLRQIIQESGRYKQAKADLAEIVKREGVDHPPENIWTIPGARRRISIGWMIYIANACGYWESPSSSRHLW
jgi:putative MFS transporter